MRIDPRVLIGAVAVILGFVVTCGLISGADTTSPFLAADGALTRGTFVTEANFKTIDVKFPEEQQLLAWPVGDEFPEGAILIEPIPRR